MELWKCFFLGLVLFMAIESAEAGLRPNYYQSTCPSVEKIVFEAVRKKVFQTFVTIPATLRLFFHDCFVTGCDASVMIFSPTDNAEKDAPDDQSLAGDGFDTVIKAKQAVEAECPGVVSCADILAIAARDVVVLSGGPNFTVELGRLDGLVSSASLVEGRLPSPDYNLSQLLQLFGKHNLGIIDVVALSGAHTVGFSHCSRFADRLYHWNSTESHVDPTLNPSYAKALMAACPPDVNPTIAVDMDPFTASVFDNQYYKNLQNYEGLFTSDEVLYTDQRSRPYVNQFAANQYKFFTAFSVAMVKLGRVDVKFGAQGQIRLDCTKFN